MRKWFHKTRLLLLGDPGFAELDQRMVNIICILGGTVSIISIPLNFYLVNGFYLTFLNLIEAMVLFGFYFYSRVTGNYRPLIWPMVASIHLFLSVNWFYDGGSHGGTQYYFLVLALGGSIMLKGHSRNLNLALTILLVSGLMTIEYLYPELVEGIPGEQSRLVNIVFNFNLSVLLIGITVAVLSRHNQQLLYRIERKNRDLVKDLALARALQEDLLEADEKFTADYDFSYLFRPSAGVGGDFFHLTPLPDGLRILIADMKGHGINAALTAMLAKSEWAHLGHETMEPGEALDEFNRVLVERYGGATLLCACVADVYEDRVLFASGGFPSQILYNDGIAFELAATGPLLGMTGDFHYHSMALNFGENSKLVLFSDALVEENDQNGAIIGPGWLVETVKKCGGSSTKFIESIVDRFVALTGKKPGFTTDDLTIIAVGLLPNRIRDQ